MENRSAELVVGITYVTVQFVALLIYSCYGFLYVRETKKNIVTCKNDIPQQSSVLSLEMQVASESAQDEQQQQQNTRNINDTIEGQDHGTSDANDIDKGDAESARTPTTIVYKKEKAFVKEWAHVVWKMRSVYSSFIVHSFDIVTDLMVIVQWWYEEECNDIDNECVSTDNVDTKLMAYVSIGVIFFHKIISSTLIYLCEGDIIRALLQFFDLLIFQEIYLGHQKICQSMKNSESISKPQGII